MIKYAGRYRIESARLPDRNYAGGGLYFVTSVESRYPYLVVVVLFGARPSSLPQSGLRPAILSSATVPRPGTEGNESFTLAMKLSERVSSGMG